MSGRNTGDLHSVAEILGLKREILVGAHLNFRLHEKSSKKQFCSSPKYEQLRSCTAANDKSKAHTLMHILYFGKKAAQGTPCAIISLVDQYESSSHLAQQVQHVAFFGSICHTQWSACSSCLAAGRLAGRIRKHAWIKARARGSASRGIVGGLFFMTNSEIIWGTLVQLLKGTSRQNISSITQPICQMSTFSLILASLSNCSGAMYRGDPCKLFTVK